MQEIALNLDYEQIKALVEGNSINYTDFQTGRTITISPPKPYFVLHRDEYLKIKHIVGMSERADVPKDFFNNIEKREVIAK